VDLLWDRRANLPKGSAYVEFLERKDAENAQVHLNGVRNECQRISTQ
jgi:RNA recognition motif-containing protein